MRSAGLSRLATSGRAEPCGPGQEQEAVTGSNAAPTLGGRVVKHD